MSNDGHLAGLRRRHADLDAKITRLSKSPAMAEAVARLKKEKLALKDEMARQA